jgi:hypothetical protein
VRFVLCGHALGDGVGRLTTQGRTGNTVHQLLSNHQMLPHGGQGFIRALELSGGDRRVRVRTYSPFVAQFLDGPDSSFELEIDLEPIEEPPIRE